MRTEARLNTADALGPNHRPKGRGFPLETRHRHVNPSGKRRKATESLFPADSRGCQERNARSRRRMQRRIWQIGRAHV